MERHGVVAAIAAITMLGLASPAVAAKQKPDLVVGKVRAFGVAATGGNAYVTVTVRNRGRGRTGASQVGLQLQVVNAGAARRLTVRRASVPALRPGRSRTLKLTAGLPADVAAGTSFGLKVCADARRRVRERKESNNCGSSKPVLVTEATVGALVRAAVSLHVIGAGTGAVYLAQAAAGDPGLPREFRVKSAGPQLGDHAAAVVAASAYAHLSRRDRRRMAPFLVPAAVRKQVRAALASRAHGGAHSAGATRDCSYISAITRRKVNFAFAVKQDFQGISAAGDKAVVWFRKDSPGDRSSALRYAQALNEAWPKLTKQFRAPLSDADRECLNAGDGRFDLYVNDDINNRAQTLPTGTWRPAGADGPDVGGVTCTHTPAYMEAKPGLPQWAIAHELMHAIQFAYTYKDCNGYQNAWWDEGSATWAGDFVYPKDDFEHVWIDAFEQSPAPIWRLNSEYGTWVFWYFLTKTQGVSAINKVFGSLAHLTSRPAVNAAIPGGFAKQFPLYLRWLRNGPPVASPGFPVTKSYLGWDRLPTRAKVSSDVTLSLSGQPQRTIVVPVIAGDEADYCVPLATATPYRFHQDHCPVGYLGPEGGTYLHVALPDKNVRELKFTNGIFGKAGEHVEAWMRLADGSWKAADWSAKDTTLCRDKASENVQELYVVSANVAAGGDGFLARNLQHQLQGRNTCGFPKRFDGTWTRIYTWPGGGSWTETITGSVSYVHDPHFPPELDGLSSIPYVLEGGTISWTVSGSAGDVSCPTTFSGAGSEPATSDTSFGTPTVLTLENVSANPAAPQPEPKPFYYSIRDGQDPLKAPLYNVADCNTSTTEGLVLPYLDVGFPSPFDADTPSERIQKSDSATLLAGHRAGPDSDPSFMVNDTWSFKGSS